MTLYKKMLQTANLTARIDNKVLLSDINLTFQTGKTYAILGPNGSGKSTLANVLMGNSTYSLESNSKIYFWDEDITELEANKRSEKGIFLSFQTPQALSGITIYQLLQSALNDKRDPLTIRKEVKEKAGMLNIKENLLNRSLNEGASGGERKKIEALQAVILQKKVCIFDEIDTGVDVDSLKDIGEFLASHKKNRTYVIITHYNRILNYLKPDEVVVMVNGRVKKIGDKYLAEEVEKKGYNQ